MGWPLFEVNQQQTEEVRHVRIAGEVDMSAREALQSAFADLAEVELVIDATKVTFIDSTALACLVAAKQDARSCRLMPSDKVMRLLTITGTADFFDVVSDPTSPVESEEGGSAG